MDLIIESFPRRVSYNRPAGSNAPRLSNVDRGCSLASAGTPKHDSNRSLVSEFFRGSRVQILTVFIVACEPCRAFHLTH